MISRERPPRGVRLSDILGGPIDLSDPSELGIVGQFTPDHVLAIDEENRLVPGSDLSKGRLPVHAQIIESESPVSVDVVENQPVV